MLFTDGSSLGNPGPGGWGAVLVTDHTHVAELGGYVAHTTNNRMELSAVMEGLKHLGTLQGALLILTDSKYVHMGATEWAAGWKRRGWMTMAKTPVENRDLWEEALALLETRKKAGPISWKHVPGHSGLPGNERCDAIATGFAKEDMPGLYDGSLDEYPVDILHIAIDEARSQQRSDARARSRIKAHSYLSLIDGVAKRHMTWAECESRVKGKAGVKFKKAISADDERAILAQWGAKLS